jgi:hypothetical protein
VLAASQALTKLGLRKLAAGEHLERDEIRVVGHKGESM